MWRAWIGAGWILANGCAAPAPAPVAAPQAMPSTSHVEQAQPAAASETSVATPVASVELATPEVPKAEENPAPPSRGVKDLAAAQADDNAPREITYRGSPEGLLIEIEGVHLFPKAEALRLADGSYGVRLTVRVESGDGTAHHLLTPANGALSLYSRVYDKSGKLAVERGDERRGQEALLLVPGMKTVLTRQWPGAAGSGELWWGRTLKLEVGLWGLGRIESDRRPVKRLFMVEMKVGASPRPIIQPPQLY